MSSRLPRYYYGSYGLIRGYGPLCRTIGDAEASVRADSDKERQHGGNTDRHVVLVERVTGLCWWIDDVEIDDLDLAPVRMLDGKQANYGPMVIARHEALWGSGADSVR